MSPRSDCAEIRAALGACRDGHAHDEQRLAEHLARCDSCAEFERELAGFAPHWRSLAALEPPPELWARIETALAPAPVRFRPAARLALHAAAALIGFLGAHLAAAALEREPRPGRHLLERMLDTPRVAGESLAQSPELRLLRARQEAR